MGLLSANSKMLKWATKGTLAALEVTAFCKHLPSTIACSFLDIKLRSPDEGHRLRRVAQPLSSCYLARVGWPRLDSASRTYKSCPETRTNIMPIPLGASFFNVYQ